MFRGASAGFLLLCLLVPAVAQATFINLGGSMEFGFSPEEQKLLEDVRRFLKSESTPALLSESQELGHIYGGREGRKFIQKFAARGWLIPNWPEKYGGLGMSATVSFAIREEMALASVPSEPSRPFNIIAPTCSLTRTRSSS